LRPAIKTVPYKRASGGEVAASEATGDPPAEDGTGGVFRPLWEATALGQRSRICVITANSAEFVVASRLVLSLQFPKNISKKRHNCLTNGTGNL